MVLKRHCISAQLLICAIITAAMPLSLSGQSPAWRTVNTRAVSIDTPTLRAVASTEFPLGSINGLELFNTRRVLFTPQKTILIAGGREPVIREVGRDGKLVRTVGRAGSGPGEFRSVGSFYVSAGDTLFVQDAPQQRVSVFTPDRRFVRVTESAMTAICCSASGAFVVPKVTEDASSGALRLAVADFTVVGSAAGRSNVGAADRPLFRDRHGKARLILEQQGDQGGFFSFSGVYDVPYLPTPQIEWNGEDVVYVGGSSYELRIARHDRSAFTRVRIPVTPPPLTQRMVRVGRDSAVSAARDGDSAALSAALGRVNWPERLPAIDKLLVDYSGVNWVKSYVPTANGGERWLGVRSDGEIVGVVHLASGLEALAFGHGHVLVRSVDEDTGFDRFRALFLSK